MSGIPSDGPHQLDTRSQALEEPVCALLWASEDEEELPGAFGGDVLSPAHQGLCVVRALRGGTAPPQPTLQVSQMCVDAPLL